MHLDRRKWLFRYRLSLGIFIFGLVVSGLTAFPLEIETAILNNSFGVAVPADESSVFFRLRVFVTLAHAAIFEMSSRFPFLPYATDWLGFAHFVIAAFFALPFFDPLRYRAILSIGLLACAGVIVVALIAGPVRGIPFLWTLIDCSFGIFGAIPLVYCLRLTRQDED